MSLRDQLLKAGLVSKDKIKEAEKSQKKEKHRAFKDPKIKAELDAKNREKMESLAKIDAEKRMASFEANKKVKTNSDKKALRLEARRIIDEHRVNDENADDSFNFSPDGKKIRAVKVTKTQRKQLSDGLLAICRNDRDGFDYPLVPKKNAERLVEIEKEIGERIIYLLIDPNEVIESEAADEWAAWDAFEAENK